MPSGKALKHLKSSSGAPDGSTLQLRVCYCEQVRLSYDQSKKKKKRECRRFERVQTESSASVQFGNTDPHAQNQVSRLLNKRDDEFSRPAAHTANMSHLKISLQV